MYVIMRVDGYYPDSMTNHVVYSTIEEGIDEFEHYRLSKNHSIGDTLVDDDDNLLVGKLSEHPDYRLTKLTPSSLFKTT